MKTLSASGLLEFLLLRYQSMNPDFFSLYAVSKPDARYLLDERAAIHEFDGLLDRDEAERRAAEEVEKQLKETCSA